MWDNAQLEESVRTLLNYSFEWVLPGHGERIHLPCRDMKNAVEKLIYQGRWNRLSPHNLKFRFITNIMRMGVEVDRLEFVLTLYLNIRVLIPKKIYFGRAIDPKHLPCATAVYWYLRDAAFHAEFQFR